VPVPPSSEGAAGPDERARLEAWDDAHLWHPFTPHSVYRREEPLLIAAAEGHYLIDVDGRRYLDGVASLWCNAFGHRHPHIDDAVAAQLGRVAHATLLGHATVPAVLLARRLAELAPARLTRVFFSDDGSTAVEVALKIALQHWQQRDGGAQARRRRFLAFTSAYHGDTVGAVSVGGIELFHARFGALLFDVVRAPAPYCYRCPLGLAPDTCGTACLAELERLLAEHGEDLAAVVVEPGFQGAAGIVTYPGEFLRRVAELTRAAGALLICDEVAAGMGRGGELFASAALGLEPDLLCVAKALTGGYLPLAATLATEEVFAAFLGPPEEGRTFFHGHTYTGNALGAAAALATLELFAEPATLPAVRARAAQLAEAVERLRALPAVGDVRCWGLAAGIELVAERAGKRAYPPGERRGTRVCLAARERGVFLRPLGDVVVLMPPLSIEERELELLVDAVAYGIATACGDALG
jgi:adenosylmethionine-8-amino-7-oxononanoate aminotransferase